MFFPVHSARRTITRPPNKAMSELMLDSILPAVISEEMLQLPELPDPELRNWTMSSPADKPIGYFRNEGER